MFLDRAIKLAAESDDPTLLEWVFNQPSAPTPTKLKVLSEPSCPPQVLSCAYQHRNRKFRAAAFENPTSAPGRTEALQSETSAEVLTKAFKALNHADVAVFVNHRHFDVAAAASAQYDRDLRRATYCVPGVEKYPYLLVHYVPTSRYLQLLRIDQLCDLLTVVDPDRSDLFTVLSQRLLVVLTDYVTPFDDCRHKEAAIRMLSATADHPARAGDDPLWKVAAVLDGNHPGYHRYRQRLLKKNAWWFDPQMPGSINSRLSVERGSLLSNADLLTYALDQGLDDRSAVLALCRIVHLEHDVKITEDQARRWMMFYLRWVCGGRESAPAPEWLTSSVGNTLWQFTARSQPRYDPSKNVAILTDVLEAFTRDVGSDQTAALMAMYTFGDSDSCDEVVRSRFVCDIPLTEVTDCERALTCLMPRFVALDPDVAARVGLLFDTWHGSFNTLVDFARSAAA